jgi:hypothetical protein
MAHFFLIKILPSLNRISDSNFQNAMDVEHRSLEKVASCFTTLIVGGTACSRGI